MDWINFQKPQRYMGNEWNAVHKDPAAKLRVCLCFPDVYEVGMSNLGLRIIYGMLNRDRGVFCERAFMPGPDLENHLKISKQKLFSLETKTALDRFDVLAFNLGCELNYTNVLAMLERSGLDLHAEKREDILVMAGGIANPEPMARFIDVFFLGEFEAQAERFLEVMTAAKTKQERLQALSCLEGFYVPAFYSPPGKNLKTQWEKKYPPACFPLKKVHVRDLDTSFYPLKWVTPYTQIVHDRVQVEIARGCPNQCSFCQARCYYYPYREKKLETVCKQIETLYRETGYENFSLLSLSASNYSRIEELIDYSVDFFRGKGVGLSLPSLRVDDVVGRLHRKLLALKKTNLTVALEAGTERMREKIRKNIDVNCLLEAKSVLKTLGLRHIKLYFMFGFPEEREDDVYSIARLSRVLLKELGLKLNVSINVFIPKPFTPLEQSPLEDESVLQQKKNILLSSLGHRRINVSVSNIKRSILEAVMSRGDRDLGRVIENAFLKGARFDSYADSFNWDLWQDSFKEENIDYGRYIYDRDSHLAWSHIKIK